MKKIIVVTGCRSEYDIIYSVLKLMNSDNDFDVSVIACGAHLSSNFGYTVAEIEKDGFKFADRIHSLIDSDSEIGKVKGASILMQGLSESLNRLEPDYVMVAGDREESIISGIVCTYLGIPLIHLCGGDSTSPEMGDVDEPVRHATSKLANIHFTMNENHKERLIKMGEEPWRICNSGNPALDRFEEIPKMNKDEVSAYFGFTENKPLVLVVQHVISGEVDDAARQISETLKAVTSMDVNCILNYPNTDMGSRDIIDVIEKYKENDNVRISKHIPRNEFVNLLRNLDLLVGNSSMAILEGSFLKIPSINVGERNLNRINGGNVVFVDPKEDAIADVAGKILFDLDFSNKLKGCEPIYGDGKASIRIIDFMKSISKSKVELLSKKITY